MALFLFYITPPLLGLHGRAPATFRPSNARPAAGNRMRHPTPTPSVVVAAARPAEGFDGAESAPTGAERFRPPPPPQGRPRQSEHTGRHGIRFGVDGERARFRDGVREGGAFWAVHDT